MRRVFYFCLFIVLKKGGNKGVLVMDEVMNDGLFLLGGVLGFLCFFFLSLGVSYVCMYFYYYYFCYGLFVVTQDLGSSRVILGDSLMLCEGEY